MENVNRILLGDVRELIKSIPSNSIDLILTDPPYELGSFRKEVGSWEGKGVVYSHIWQEFFRVLKDGGHIVSFSSNRTLYKFGKHIEEAGFDIRDTLIWQYAQGIPRNMDLAKAIDAHKLYGKTSSKYLKQVEQEHGGKEYTIVGTNNTMFGDKVEFTRKEYSPVTDEGKQWEGWGTNLAPSFEPIILARKPFKGSLAENMIINGVGGLNIGGLKEINGKYPSNVLQFPKAIKDSFNSHPMVKPTELLKYLIHMITKENTVILDPFSGSGSTAVATLECGGNRKYIGFEVNEKFVEIANKRINNTNLK